jgi:hypothetical protein
MHSALRLTFVILTSVFAVVAVGCQWFTGAHVRGLRPEEGTDSGSPVGGTGATGSGGVAGTEGASGATGNGGSAVGSGGSGGATAGSGGSAGAPDAGIDADDGAARPDVAVPNCEGAYFDWFQSSFAAIDRKVVGSADRPSMPWNTVGNLEILGARLSGKGTATAFQGEAFGYDGLRLRFKGRFTDPGQFVGVAVNSRSDGGMGLRIDVMAKGTVLLTENGVERGVTTLRPLALDRDWFLELRVGASRVTVRLGDVNYPDQTGSVTLASIESAPVANSAAGEYLSVALNGAAELPSSLDEVSVARCARIPPNYQPILNDTFERPDSPALGHAEFPPTSAWSTQSTAVSIVRRTLYFADTDGGPDGIAATVPFDGYSMDAGIRLRFAFRSDSDLPQFYVAAIYNVSVTLNAPTFTISSNDGRSIDLGAGSASRNFAEAIASPDPHYVQVDLQGDIAVLTLRTGSYAGPILGIVAGSILPKNAGTVQEVTLMVNQATAIEEIEVARYGL